MHTYTISFTCTEPDVASLLEAVEAVLRGYREAVPEYDGDTECHVERNPQPFAA